MGAQACTEGRTASLLVGCAVDRYYIYPQRRRREGSSATVATPAGGWVGLEDCVTHRERWPGRTLPVGLQGLPRDASQLCCSRGHPNPPPPLRHAPVNRAFLRPTGSISSTYALHDWNDRRVYTAQRGPTGGPPRRGACLAGPHGPGRHTGALGAMGQRASAPAAGCQEFRQERPLERNAHTTLKKATPQRLHTSARVCARVSVHECVHTEVAAHPLSEAWRCAKPSRLRRVCTSDNDPTTIVTGRLLPRGWLRAWKPPPRPEASEPLAARNPRGGVLGCPTTWLGRPSTLRYPTHCGPPTHFLLVGGGVVDAAAWPRSRL